MYAWDLFVIQKVYFLGKITINLNITVSEVSIIGSQTQYLV